MRMSWCVSLNGKCVEGVQAIPQGRELFVLLHIPGPPPPSPYCLPIFCSSPFLHIPLDVTLQADVAAKMEADLRALKETAAAAAAADARVAALGEEQHREHEMEEAARKEINKEEERITAAQQEYWRVVAEVEMKQEALEAEISKVVSRAPALQRSMEAALEEAALKNSLLEEKLKQ